MAWLPIDGLVPQSTESGNQANGMVLKFYEPGTTTPLTVATTSTGATTTTEFLLDVQGYTTLSAARVIPHVDRIYKVALYLNQADADADATGSAVFVEDNVAVAAAFSEQFATVASMVASTTIVLGQLITVEDYAPGNNAGVLFFKVVAAGTGTPDGGKFIDLPNTTPALQAQQIFNGDIKATGFGAANTGDNSGEFAAALAIATGPVSLLNDDTYDISAVTVMPNGTSFEGGGFKNTVINNTSTSRVFSTVDDAGVSKDFGIYLKRFGMTGTNNTTPATSAMRFIDMGKCGAEEIEVNGHETGLELEACVGFRGVNLTLQNHTHGVLMNSPSNLGGVTYTSFDKLVCVSNTNAVTIDGFNRGAHFNECDFESNTNLLANLGVSTDTFHNLVFRNNWFEGNRNYDLLEANMPVVETSYFGGDITFSGGMMPKFKDVHITGTTNWQIFKTDSEASEVSATGVTFDNVGQHGLSLTMPKIGSASSPVDKQYTQGVAQSMLFAELGGTLHGYSQALKNLIFWPVSQVAFAPGGTYWPIGGATVTTGQADMFGGTNATLLSAAATHGSSFTAVTSGVWNVLQMSFKMVAADEEFGLQIISNGGTAPLNKISRYTVGDTEWRVAHVLFKPDSIDARITIYLPSSGIIVHRIGVFEGTKVRPMIGEGRDIATPFIMEFDKVKAFSATTPVAGTWAVGDEIVYPAPVTGGHMGEVCIVAGTPGTWKTHSPVT